jgi:hypothetical protein
MVISTISTIYVQLPYSLSPSFFCKINSIMLFHIKIDVLPSITQILFPQYMLHVCVVLTLLKIIQIYFGSCLFYEYFLWLCSPPRVMASSPTRFLDHTQRRVTVGRTPLDEWSARRRDLWQHTTHTTDKHPCPWRDSNPRSQWASGRRPARPRGHWDRHFGSYTVPFRIFIEWPTECTELYTSFYFMWWLLHVSAIIMSSSGSS